MKMLIKTLNERKCLLAGLIFSIAPPAAATLTYFPLWQERGAGAALSGFSLLLILISALPLMRLTARLLKTPSAWGIWLIIFFTFTLLSSIADEMRIISLVGAAGGAIGAIFFKLDRRCRKEK